MVTGCKTERPKSLSGVGSQNIPDQPVATARIFEVTTYITYNLIRQVFHCRSGHNNRDLGMMSALSEHHTRAIQIAKERKVQRSNT